MVTRITKKLPTVNGHRYRLTTLDNCGAPVYGEDGQYVGNGVVSVALTVVTNDTDAVTSQDSDGNVCLDVKAKSTFDGVSGEVILCGLDPDYFEKLTGMPVVRDIDGNVVGVVWDSDVNPSDHELALEMWTGLGGEETCGEVGAKPYGYILLKRIQVGRPGDITIQQGAINWTISNLQSKKGGSWGKGPYDVVVNEGDVAGPLLQSLTSGQQLLAIQTLVAPPAAMDAAQPLLDPTWTTLTDIEADAEDGDMAVDFSVSPTIPEGEGVFYDFGDGTWDYVTEDGGDATHTFAEAGTYTVTAQSGGSAVVSVEVTVPFDAS